MLCWGLLLCLAALLTALLILQLLSTSVHAVLGFVVVFGVVFQAAVGSRKVYLTTK